MELQNQDVALLDARSSPSKSKNGDGEDEEPKGDRNYRGFDTDSGDYEDRSCLLSCNPKLTRANKHGLTRARCLGWARSGFGVARV